MTVLPSVEAIEFAFEKKCHSTCCGKKSDGDSSNGCQKDNCLLNINFNNSTFLVFDSTLQLQSFVFITKTKINRHNESDLFSGYTGVIWQPPEKLFSSLSSSINSIYSKYN